MANNTLLVTLAKPNPSETELFHSYVGASTKLAVDAGGEVSSRFAVEHLHGDAPAVVFGLATFPSHQSIVDMFSAPDYQALVPGRDKSVESVNAYIIDDTPITELPELEGDAVYLVTVAEPDPDAGMDLAAYQQVAGPLAGRHGGRPVVNLPVTGRPVGDTPAAFIGIVEFPSAAAVEAYFADPEYVAVVDVRDRALRALNLYVSAA